MAEVATVPSEEEMGVLDNTRTVREVNLWRPVDPVAIVPDSTRLHYEEETGFGTMLVDMKNAFNELSRYVMLWHCCHAWPHASRFGFNWYWHFNIVIFRNGPGEAPCIILSQEGIAQGDVFGLNLYGVTLTPLCNRMKLAVPQAVQLWYADDTSGTGNAKHNAKCLAFLVKNGPAFGYFPEPAKAIYIYKGHDEMIARHHFEKLELAVEYSQGHGTLVATSGARKGSRIGSSQR